MATEVGRDKVSIFHLLFVCMQQQGCKKSKTRLTPCNLHNRCAKCRLYVFLFAQPCSLPSTTFAYKSYIHFLFRECHNSLFLFTMCASINFVFHIRLLKIKKRYLFRHHGSTIIVFCTHLNNPPPPPPPPPPRNGEA